MVDKPGTPFWAWILRLLDLYARFCKEAPTELCAGFDWQPAALPPTEFGPKASCWLPKTPLELAIELPFEFGVLCPRFRLFEVELWDDVFVLFELIEFIWLC